MPQTIALVDDDRNILTSVAMTLEAEGFIVRVFSDGAEALKGLTAQPVDLAIGRCRLVVAARREFDYASAVQRGARLKVATKYVGTAREHFSAKGIHVDLIKLYGSMELAPLVGLADLIVDLVSTGRTLQANDLVVVEDIRPISARLIVNPAALKLKRAALQPMLDAVARAARSDA